VFFSSRCQVGKTVPGALILSEFTGACQSLCGAIRVNPWNVEQIVQALHQVTNDKNTSEIENSFFTNLNFMKAVTMSPEERTTKHEYNLRYVSTHTALTWASTLLNTLLHSEFGLFAF
jgi:trehalose-6-phosphate synthase